MYHPDLLSLSLNRHQSGIIQMRQLVSGFCNLLCFFFHGVMLLHTKTTGDGLSYSVLQITERYLRFPRQRFTQRSERFQLPGYKLTVSSTEHVAAFQPHWVDFISVVDRTKQQKSKSELPVVVHFLFLRRQVCFVFVVFLLETH